MNRHMNNPAARRIARPITALAILAGLTQATLSAPGALAALAGSRPIRLEPGTSGYWKHPPLPQDSTATGHLPPRWSGYWKHPPAPDPARVHTAMTAAMNGWQISLIAASAALLAATITLLVRRARAVRRATGAAL